MDNQAADSSSNNIPRDAIIYIPGLNFVPSQSLESITQQIADAFGPIGYNSPAIFSIEATPQQVDYQGRKFNYRTFYKEENGRSTRAMDVYELDYLPILTHDFADKHPFSLLLRLLLLFILNLGNLRSLFKSPLKTAKEKTQVIYALVMVGAVVAYMVIVGFAVYTLIKELPQLQSDAQGESAQEQTSYPGPSSSDSSESSENSSDNTASDKTIFGLPLRRLAVMIAVMIAVLIAALIFFGKTWPRAVMWVAALTGILALVLIVISLQAWPEISQAIVILIAALQLWLPTLFEDLRQGIQRSAIYALSVADYFKLGTKREEIAGLFLDLLEYLSKRDDRYDQVYVVTHSFGSIVAFDSIFPAAHDPVPQIKVIDKLVTIGNPSDFSRSLWPTYFRKRSEIRYDEGKTFSWLNVYSPIDILGSNFRKDSEVGSPDPDVIQGMGLQMSSAPINMAYPRDVSYADKGFFELIVFTGLQAHVTYFRQVTKGETTCFLQIMPQLLQGTAWLA